MTVKENQNLKLTKSGTHSIKRRRTDQAPEIKNTICNNSTAEHCVSFFLSLLARSKPRSFSIHYLKHIALWSSFGEHAGWECVLGVRSVWSILGSVFDEFIC